MLKIWVAGFREGCIKNPGSYFNRYKKKEWFNREDVKEVIKEIDTSVAIKDEYIESPVYGGISPRDLSQGCKSVILLYINPTCNVYATRCGDNCFPAIMRLAEKTDVVITLHHVPVLPRPFKALMMDTGIEVNSPEEFVTEFSIIDGSIDESERYDRWWEV